MKRAVATALLVAFLAFTAQASLLSQRHLLDARLSVLLAAALLAAPAGLLLALAARARGAGTGWLMVAVAWGAFAAAWLSFAGEATAGSIWEPISTALVPFGAGVVREAPFAVVAPIIEEPAKAAGVAIVLTAIRQARASLGVAMGAAVGGLVGLSFGVAEMSHRIGELVNELGYIDLSGAFVVDWGLIRGVTELQFIQRFALGGLTNHTLFSALAGVGIVLALQGRWRAASGWMVASLLAHGLHNSIGVSIGESVFGELAGDPRSGRPAVLPGPVAAWLAAAVSFLVAEAWAALLLVRRLRGA